MKLSTTKLNFFILCTALLLSASPAYSQYWMQKGGSGTIDEAQGISVDDSANTYTTGYFTGTAGFGAFNISALGVSDIFLAKTNASGVYKWVVKAGDGGSDRGLAVKTDAKGNSYVTGFYYGTAHFGAFTITAAGFQDMFVAKYNRNGVCKWVVSGGGTQSDIGNAINIDAAGNVLVTGEFAGSASFGTFNLTSTGNNVNVFTAKLDSANGNFLWAKSGVGPHTDRGLGVACDQSNNVYITGQFTDTITFGSLHFTNLYNAIFLVKYDANGNEQWFTYAGGGTFNIANGIDVDRNNNIYLTGDFTGTLSFFVSPTFNLINTYANRIFVAKYDASAHLLWATADGSNGSLTSRAIGVDSLGNAYIVGNFDCKMNSYADQYGQGTFNTVGYLDVFGASYSATGAWQWSRQIGSHLNNYANAVAVTHKGDVFTAGSFDQDMIVADNPANFVGWNTTNINCNGAYCSDNNYGDFTYFSTSGNLDVFICKPFDLSRQTYDFYNRNGAGCNRDFVGVCIDGPNCLDTVTFCGSGAVNAYTHTCNQAGPIFTYLWSNNQVGSGIGVSSAGSYSVTQTTVDGCFSSKDTIYVKILPPPAQPTLSDNVIINTNATSPLPIHICGDSVKLWGGNYGGYTYNWSGGSTATTVSIEATKSGTYCFNIKDINGCSNQVCVTVTLDSALPIIKPKLKCVSCKAPYYDTAFVCKGNPFTEFPYDSISNPTGNQSKCIPPLNDVYNYWFASPAANVSYSPMTTCGANSFSPQDSGWYQITDTIKLEDLCDTDKYIVHDSVFVRLYPLPIVGPVSITGGGNICPGDSVLLVVHDTAKFVWNNGSTLDSLWIKNPGGYTVSTTEKNQYGCTATAAAWAYVGTKTTPAINITMSATTICPGDSLQLTCTGGAGGSTYQWNGPSGPVGGNSAVIWVKTAGVYYCINTDTNYCNPSLSNSVIVNSYATPYLALPANTLLCAGDSVKVLVNASSGSTIQWQAPLSGSDSVKYIKVAGTFTCKIVSCGITTVASITITKDNPTAQITALGGKAFCVGDSVTLTASSATSYLWNPGGANTKSITVKTTGIYTLTTTDSNGCRAIDTIHVKANDFTVAPPIVSDTAVCVGSLVSLYAWGTGSILWYDSLGGNIINTGSPYFTNINSNMVFYVVVDEGGCLSAVKTINVTLADCGDLYVPNVFSPNGDGNNDVWHVTFPGAKCFHVEIYNRWGVKVFVSNSVQEGWDGKIMQTGMDASDGVYYYILNYCSHTGETGTDHGFIQLIR